MPGDRGPEPNFARLITDDDLRRIAISAHALRRFVQRLQPDIPGADQVAVAMARLEDIGSGRRSGPEQGQLNRYRDWMTRHAEPVVLDLIRCEGFWATERPRWSRSDTPSDGYLQVGRMCGFPSVLRGHEIVLATCTNGRDITWDIALSRHYTLMPKPYTTPPPVPVRAPGWTALIARAWRSRRKHGGPLAALRHERAGQVPLPEGLTPHKLRHTHASILVALGVDPGSVMDQLGHADPGFTLRVYRHGMRRDPAAKERLRALVGGADWPTIANSAAQPPWSELAGTGRPSLGSVR